MNIDNIKSQMRKGTLEYCILLIVRDKEAYASDIIKILQDIDMIVVEGTLYPLLTRMKNGGLMSYRWVESPQGPPRKYYTITEKGSKFLVKIQEAWAEINSNIKTLEEITL